MKRLILGLALSALHAVGGVIPGQSHLMAGRCLLPIPNQASSLTGRAPADTTAAPYAISNGITLLWQGQAGEPFSLPAQPHIGQLYLHSAASSAAPWQDLAWGEPLTSTGNAPPTQRLSGKEAGLLPGSTSDAGPALRQLLARAAASPATHTTIALERGTYHFYPGQEPTMSLYLSNHDQQDQHDVAIPLVNLQHTTLEAHGSTFIFHGDLLPILIMDSAHLRLRGVRLAYATPHEAEGTITATDHQSTTLELEPDGSWQVADGLFCTPSSGGMRPIHTAFAFRQDGRVVPTGRAGDYPWPASAQQTGPNQVTFSIPRSAHGLEVGHRLALHHGSRPRPAIALYRAEDILLDDVAVHNSQGMALLAQRSADITIRGGGCLRQGRRAHTTTADATHFSNCRGRILVEGATFEGMLDDAINVHSTCLAIQAVSAPNRITCRYRHPQSVGFETFLPGERVQFIRSQTLENTGALGRAAHVRKIDERLLEITLQEPLPPGIGVGDAVENADWYPSVTFRRNTIRDNRARGALFNTPRPVLVEGNHFDHSSGSAILLAGDASGWYESGRCQDVLIQGNVFEHCLTTLYQFTRGIISIAPEIRQSELQQEPYHRHIRITGNTFLTHSVPLLSTASTGELTCVGNLVLPLEDVPCRCRGPLRGGFSSAAVPLPEIFTRLREHVNRLPDYQK